MKDLRFSIVALIALTAFSLYLVGVNEAEDLYALIGFTFLSILGMVFCVANDD